MHVIMKRRKSDDDSNPTGTESINPLVDTRAYENEFIYGTTAKLTANIISENLLAQVDLYGHRHLLPNYIINFRRNNDTVQKRDAFIVNST